MRLLGCTKPYRKKKEWCVDAAHTKKPTTTPTPATAVRKKERYVETVNRLFSAWIFFWSVAVVMVLCAFFHFFYVVFFSWNSLVWLPVVCVFQARASVVRAHFLCIFIYYINFYFIYGFYAPSCVSQQDNRLYI